MPDTRTIAWTLVGLLAASVVASTILAGDHTGVFVVLGVWLIFAQTRDAFFLRRVVRLWPLPLCAVAVLVLDTEAVLRMPNLLAGLLSATAGTALGIATVRPGTALHRWLWPPDPTLGAQMQRMIAAYAWEKGHHPPHLHLRVSMSSPPLIFPILSANSLSHEETIALSKRIDTWVDRAMAHRSFDPTDPLLHNRVEEDGGILANIPPLHETAHAKLHRLAQKGQSL